MFHFRDQLHNLLNSPMYGLPKQIDLNFLQGRELLQLCVGLYQIQLNFDSNVRISFQGLFTHYDENGFATEADCAPLSARLLLQLVGSSVSRVEAVANGTLLLIFRNGQRVALHDSDRGYESYEIRHAEGLIVV